METGAVCADVVVHTYQSTRHSVQKDWSLHEYPPLLAQALCTLFTQIVVLIPGLLNAVLINSTRISVCKGFLISFYHVHLGH